MLAAARLQTARSQPRWPANLSGALSRLMVVQEAYPDLKANQGFHDLQVQIEGTENRILRGREEYNAAARDYNSELLRIGGIVVREVPAPPATPTTTSPASRR